MFSKGTIVTNEIHKKIKELEDENDIKFSNTQKVLLSVEGSITAILDVLYGTVGIFTLKQKFENTDSEQAELLNIDEGEEINYREVVIFGRGKPMVYALSYIPLSRFQEGAHKDIVGGRLPIGKILKKYQIESRREIQEMYVETPSATLKELFKTNEKFVSREYVIIENGEIIMWTKESFPANSFKEEI